MLKSSLLTVIVFCTCVYGTIAQGADNVFHVNIKAANASDKNPGTEKEPWKTLTYAGKSAKAGDTVIIHPGTYNETLAIKQAGTKEKPICFSGTELGKVILDGTVKINNWKRSSDNPKVWVTEHKSELTKLPRKHKFSKYYNSTDPRDLTMDDNPMFFTHDKKLLPGSWTVDNELNRIFVRLPDDSDPNLHEMRVIKLMYGVSIENKKIRLYTPYIQVKNLHLKRFVIGMRIMGANTLIENNIVEWCEFSAWHSYGNYALASVFKNNIFRWSGHKGAVGTSRGKFIDNKILFSNWKLSSAGWDASGVKCTSSLDTIYKGNECAYNASLGLWLDINNQGLVMEDNIVHDNQSAGLEDEVSFSNTWKNNVSYRNGTGFYLGNSSNLTIKDNIFSDNHIGMHFRFSRTRKDNLPTPENPLTIGTHIKHRNKFNDPARVKQWMDDFFKYCTPCRMVRDNKINNNMFLNNWLEIYNPMIKNLPDPSEKYLIDNNSFENNIFINKKPSKLLSGCRNLYDFIKKHPESNKSEYFSELDLEKLPEWAATLYKRHEKRLNYPRSFNSITPIRTSLRVRNPQASNYTAISPAGLLAIARICQSDILEKISFSDFRLHAYRINLNGESTIVLWRKHGYPSDFVPVLLKGLPASAKLKTSWGAALPISRQNDLASINVGTWPIYLSGCKEKITEVQPFKVAITGKIGKDSKLEIKLTDCIGKGKLYIDSFNDKITHPHEINISDKATVIPISIPKDLKIVSIRLAGTLNGLYSGKMIKLIEKVTSRNKLIDLQGFNSIPITKFGTCSLEEGSKLPELLQLSTVSLANIPQTLKLGKITFKVDKASCIGLASKRIKGKRPAAVTIPLNGGKYKALAFLHVVAFAPKEKGVDLIDYTLNYGDNFNSAVSMKNGVNLIDWWFDPEGKFINQKNNSYLVWSGDNGSGRNVHVYAYVWKNPNPHKEITSLTIGGGDLENNTTLGILAINALKK